MRHATTSADAQGSISAPALTVEDRRCLEHWVRSPTMAQRVVLRSRIVLALADGATGRATARALGVSRTTVDLWKQRFADGGCLSLCHDRPGRGRKARQSRQVEESRT